MDIGKYTFEEYCGLAVMFHGYSAPGVLVGGYMVEYAKAAMPEGVLYEAVVETRACLPDAVQLLTPCSTGNQRMKVLPLGRFALALYDKNSGEGVRVHLDAAKLSAWPEILAWFIKSKKKADQDVDRLFKEIEAAGNTVCGIGPITIQPRYLGHTHGGLVQPCPACGEYYPAKDGPVCKGCQGEAPYLPGQNTRPPE